METLKIDNVSFNVRKCKMMTKKDFINTHRTMRLDLTDEKYIEWTESVYARINQAQKKEK